MTFPSEEYKKFCIENRAFFWPIWEQEPGDFFESGFGYVHTVPPNRDWMRLGRYNWLPRLDQLIEMLEERGWFPEILPKLRVDGSKFYRIEARKRLGDSVLSWLQIKITVGPDPETAMLRALMEAIEKEG